MKTIKFIPVLLGLGLSAALTAGAYAQSSSQAAAAPAPASPTPAPTVVYVQRLPSPTELLSAANAQHITVERIEQSGSQITAVYKYANGQLSTIMYMPLPANEAAAAGAPGAQAPASTTVVYSTPAPAYYPYYPAYGYYPYGWYPPVGIRLGFGFGFHGR
jgi:hypothetical protein